MVVHMRHTRSHTANRRSHHALKGARFVTCKNCNAEHLMHRVCTQCGKYRGRLVIDVLKKTVKKAKKEEARKEARKAAKKPEAKPEKKEAKTK